MLFDWCFYGGQLAMIGSGVKVDNVFTNYSQLFSQITKNQMLKAFAFQFMLLVPISFLQYFTWWIQALFQLMMMYLTVNIYIVEYFLTYLIQSAVVAAYQIVEDTTDIVGSVVRYLIQYAIDSANKVINDGTDAVGAIIKYLSGSED